MIPSNAWCILPKVSHGRLDQSFYHSLPAEIHSLQQSLDAYELTHSYGLFRRMTGVGGRPEIIIEGADDVNEEWKVCVFDSLLVLARYLLLFVHICVRYLAQNFQFSFTTSLGK